MPHLATPLMDAVHAAFIEGPVSMSIASCDRDNMPALARGCGARVSPDRRYVTVFVPASQAARVLRCVQDTAAVAVVFSSPSTHRSIQLKGQDAVAGMLQDGDLQRIAAYRDAFAREVNSLGFDRLLIDTLFSCPDGGIAAIAFTPSAAFSQTPGPGAGEPLTVLA